MHSAEDNASREQTRGAPLWMRLEQARDEGRVAYYQLYGTWDFPIDDLHFGSPLVFQPPAEVLTPSPGLGGGGTTHRGRTVHLLHLGNAVVALGGSAWTVRTALEDVGGCRRQLFLDVPLGVFVFAIASDHLASLDSTAAALW
uniref:Uncharacterized protein n=1 Tax=Eutreptiella gymnastica TaxID=73025 RepID=A0A7S4LDQ2_9EUGL